MSANSVPGPYPSPNRNHFSTPGQYNRMKALDGAVDFWATGSEGGSTGFFLLAISPSGVNITATSGDSINITAAESGSFLGRIYNIGVKHVTQDAGCATVLLYPDTK